jgi:hypothetical protein
MRIDPKVETAGREMLGHAIRGELEELATLIQSVGEDAYRQCLALFVLAAGYLAVDVSKGWPTEADIREIARNAADAEKNFELGESDFYDYLSRSALRFEPLDQALGTVDAAAALPVLLTGSLLLTFHPRGQSGGTTLMPSSLRFRPRSVSTHPYCQR